MQKGGTSIFPQHPVPSCPALPRPEYHTRYRTHTPNKQLPTSSVRCRPNSSPLATSIRPQTALGRKTIGRGLHRQQRTQHTNPRLAASAPSLSELVQIKCSSRGKASRERDWGCSLQFLASARCPLPAPRLLLQTTPTPTIALGPSSPARQRRRPCIIATSGVIKELLPPFNFHPHQRLA